MPQYPDHFFIVEHAEAETLRMEHDVAGEPPFFPNRQAEIFASGQGKETLEALARITLSYTASLVPTPNNPGAISYLMDARLIGLIYQGVLDMSSSQPVVVRENSARLHKVMGLAQWRGGLRDKEYFLDLARGHRSPQSVLEEMTQQAQDTGALRAVQHEWYDEEGWQLVNSCHRDKATLPGVNMAMSNRKPPLNLLRINRRKTKHEKEQEAKDIALTEVPPNHHVYKAIRVHFKRNKDGSINRTRPLEGKGVKRSEVYGYIENEEFTPVSEVVIED